MIIVYRDDDSLSVFFQQGIVGAWPFNSLQAIGNGDDTVSIRNVAKEYANGSDFFEIARIHWSEFVTNSATAYGTDEATTVNALNAAFASSGAPDGVPPVVTSATSIALTTGDSLNYELTADGGVGYEWESLPAGVVTAEGNVRKLLGGSALVAGSYPFTATAVNYFGVDSETITLTVSDPPFNDTKSVNFVNQDYLSGSAAALDGTLGRAGNGAGASDAWTISFWFKPGTSGNNNQTILYFGDSDLDNGGRVQLRFRGGDNALVLFYGSNFNNLQLTTPNDSLTDSTWHHILITYDGGTTGSSSGSISSYYGRFEIWINAVSQSTTNTNSNFGWSAGIDADMFRIGRLTGNYMRNGCRVDELATWDSDQSAAVASIYNSGTPNDLSLLGTAPGHWWRMGDGDTYPTLQDSGGADFTMLNMTAADIVTDTP